MIRIAATRRLPLNFVKPWRAPAPRWRRNPPIGFIRPCEPVLVDRPPAGPGWLHEVKHDGFRILARKDGERAQVWSRRGADFTYRFPAIAEAVRGLRTNQARNFSTIHAARPAGESVRPKLRVCGRVP